MIRLDIIMRLFEKWQLTVYEIQSSRQTVELKEAESKSIWSLRFSKRMRATRNKSQQQNDGKQQLIVSNNKEMASNNKKNVSNNKETIINNKDMVSNNKEIVSSSKENVSIVSNSKDLVSNNKEMVSNNKDMASSSHLTMETNPPIKKRTPSIFVFLVACTRLYDPLCPSFGPSVSWSVGLSRLAFFRRFTSF